MQLLASASESTTMESTSAPIAMDTARVCSCLVTLKRSLTRPCTPVQQRKQPLQACQVQKPSGGKHMQDWQFVPHMCVVSRIVPCWAQCVSVSPSRDEEVAGCGYKSGDLCVLPSCSGPAYVAQVPSPNPSRKPWHPLTFLQSS